MEIWYSHVSPYPLALCYIEFAKWYDSSRKTTILSGSVGIPYDPPYAVLVGLKFDLKQKNHPTNQTLKSQLMKGKFVQEDALAVFNVKIHQNNLHNFLGLSIPGCVARRVERDGRREGWGGSSGGSTWSTCSWWWSLRVWQGTSTRNRYWHQKVLVAVPVIIHVYTYSYLVELLIPW